MISHGYCDICQALKPNQKEVFLVKYISENIYENLAL